MQTLNVLIVSSDKSKYINQLRKSKYLNKLYVTSDCEIENTIQIKFNTFKELAQKCKTLQIDIVLVEDEKWILEGIANVMIKNYVNCFAATSNWTELELSHSFARELLSKYDIKTPPKINLPLEFPVLVKGNGILKKADSMQEIISIKEQIFNNSPEISKSVYIEKYLNGKKYKIISLFDGKHLLTFPNININKDLLNDYSKSLERMLLSENAKFIGFINSEIIEFDNALYNTGFSFEFIYPDNFETAAPNDFLYICLSAIYQKLNEIEFI